MRVSFKTRPQHTEWTAMRDFWLEGDRIELYEAGWTFDHFYPIFSDPAGPCFEGWTMLSYLAALTSRIRLGVLVSANTHRHPALLANMAATLDVASGGRLEIGLGAGWSEEEHQAYGLALPPLRERFDRLEEACEILHRLLTEERTTFHGRYYRLTDARCEPKPRQVPRPPLVIGGKGEQRTLRIAARWADQWNFPNGEPDELRHKVEVLHAHCDDIGRDAAEIEVSVKAEADIDPAAFADRAAAYREAGAQHIIVHFPPPHDPARLGAFADRLTAVIG